jgi:hypothetical protein
MKHKPSYDFQLILATTVVLFIISLICIYGMFSFKLAQIHQLEPAAKALFMNRMNTVIAPFLIILILLLGICVPKRLLPTAWLNRFAVLLIIMAGAASLLKGIKFGLLAILAASLILQTVVLSMALAGSEKLHFEKKGYWVRLGSSLVHLGLILFVFDLFFYREKTLHLVLFWITTGSTVLGMLCCFYSETVVGLAGKARKWLIG